MYLGTGDVIRGWYIAPGGGLGGTLGSPRYTPGTQNG